MSRAKWVASALTSTVIASGVVLLTGGPALATSPCTRGASVSTPRPDGGGRVEVTVPATDSANTSCHLQQGYANEAVRVLQEDLVHCHGQGISIDAQFGSRTKAALQNVQRSLGISDDGVYGPFTRDKMWHLATFENNCYRYNGPGGA